MDIGIAPSYFMKKYGREEPITLFDAIDLSVRHGFRAMLLSSQMPRERALSVREYLEASPAYAHQTHLPYYRYNKNVDYGEVSKKLLFCAESSYALGADVMVAHADEFDFSVEYTPQRAFDFNRRLFEPVVEFAAKHGMRVAFENVFEDMGRGRYGSRTEELLRVCDAFPSDTVGVCWDFGHGKMEYPEGYVSAFDAVADRVICTHLHDNYYYKDLHVAPFLGDTDFSALMKIYKEKCPNVPLTLELVYGTLPRALHESYAAFLYEGCEFLRRLSK